MSKCNKIEGEWENSEYSKKDGKVINRSIYHHDGKFELIFNYIKNHTVVKTEYYSGDWRCNNNIIINHVYYNKTDYVNEEYRIIDVDYTTLKLLDFMDKSIRVLKRAQ